MIRATAAAAVLLGLAGSVLVGVLPADAATKCEGGTGSGRCITVSKVKKHVKVVEAVPLENKSKKTATMSCSFTKTVTKSMTGSVSLSVGIKAKVFVVAEASTSIDLSKSVTQTASSATTAAATVTLKPHESVTCQRTYGYVTANVKQVDRAGSHTDTKKYTVTVPVSLGARIVD